MEGGIPVSQVENPGEAAGARGGAAAPEGRGHTVPAGLAAK